MERKQVDKLLNKIIAFRQSFNITDNLFSEWCKILEPYSYEDVDKKLDEYFKDGDNFGRYPDAYYLTRYLKTEEEKSNTQEIKARCSICGKEMPYNDLEEHFDRCSSVDYVCTMSEKYMNKKLDKEKLFALSKSEFDKKYWEFCLILYDKMPDGLLKHCLENALLTHKGQKPRYTLEEIEKEI